jgi:hypothetical protein
MQQLRGGIRREASRDFTSLVPDERIFEFLNTQKAVRLWIDETLDIKLDEGELRKTFLLLFAKNALCFIVELLH